MTPAYVHWSWQTWGWIAIGIACVALVAVIYASFWIDEDDDD